MRVVLVSHAFPPDQIAGVERYTEGLATELAAAGGTVAVVAGARAGGSQCELVREERGEAVTVFWLKRPRISPTRFLRHSAALERLFSLALEETAPDVVHVNHLFEFSPRFVEAAHRRGAAVVISLWDYYFVCAQVQLTKTSGAACAGPNGGWECARTCFAHEQAAAARWRARTAYFRLLLGSAERILSPSEHVASYFASVVPDPARIRLLPLGLPAPLPSAVRAGRQGASLPLRVAVLGQVFPNKGAHVVIEALRRAALPRARLSLHGQVVEEGYARALVRQADAVSGLEFELGGPYALADLPARLAGADCVVVPSQWPETFGFVVREALALGLPVLAARIGALPEAIAEGENGFTFAHDDPSELASLLRTLDGDRALLERLRTGARRRRPLPMSAHARELRSVYAEAIDDFARGGTTTSAHRRELVRSERRLTRLGFGGRVR